MQFYHMHLELWLVLPWHMLEVFSVIKITKWVLRIIIVIRFVRYHNKAWSRLFTCIFEGLFCLVPLVTAPVWSWLSETPDVLCCCPLVSVDLGDAPPTEGLLVEFSSYYLKNREHVKWWNWWWNYIIWSFMFALNNLIFKSYFDNIWHRNGTCLS